jgi:hypothetical protein
MIRSGSSRALRALWLGLGSTLVLASACCGHHHFDQKGGGLPPRLSAVDERKVFIDRVEGSGALPGDVEQPLHAAADKLFNDTFAHLNADTERKSATRCFAGGCVVEVVYHDRCVQLNATQTLIRHAGAPLRRWPGSIYQSPGIPQPDGRLAVTWALRITNPAAKREQLKALLYPPAKAPPVFAPQTQCSSRSTDNGPAPAPSSPQPPAAPPAAQPGSPRPPEVK